MWCIVRRRVARIRLVTRQMRIKHMLSCLKMALRVVIAVDGPHRGGSRVGEVTIIVWISEWTWPSIAFLTETRIVDVGQLGACWIRTRILTGNFGTMRVVTSVLFGALLVARTRECARRATR